MERTKNFGNGEDALRRRSHCGSRTLEHVLAHSNARITNYLAELVDM
jgi:hypothetical protein